MVGMFVLAACVAPAFAGDGAEWHQDYDKAVAAAKAEGKDMLVDFTGSDWCGWCIKLDEEVFSHESFLTGARKHFVLVKLDFPRKPENKAKVPNPKRNDELNAKYGVRGYPTVLLITPNGDVIGRTGYMRGGPENYTKSIIAMREKGHAALKKVIGMVDAWKGEADAAKKAEAFQGLLAAFSSMQPQAIGSGRLVEALRTGLTSADAKVKEAVVGALLKAGIAGDDVKKAVVELDPKNEKGILERTVFAQVFAVKDEATARAATKAMSDFVAANHEMKNKADAAKACLFVGFFNMRMKNPAEAHAWASRAKELGVEDPRMKQMMDRILKETAGSAKPADKDAPEKEPAPEKESAPEKEPAPEK